MSLLAALRAARNYSAAEATRLASFGHLPEVTPDFSAFEDLTFKDGAAHYLIDARNQPRSLDPAIALFLKIAIGLGANLLFNCRTPRGRPNARHYIRLDVAGRYIYLNRIIMDARIGEVVRERGTDFRSHLPEHLVVREAPLRDGPGKHINGRWDAVEALLGAYDLADAITHTLIARDDLEQLLAGLLALADARASERATKRNLAKVLNANAQQGAAE